MKSRRATLLSFLDATRPSTLRVVGRPGIRVREAVGYSLAFALAMVVVGVVLRWHITSIYEEEMASWRARQSGVADQQTQGISDWLKERQGDAQVLAASPSVRALLRAHSEAGQLPMNRSAVLTGSSATLDEMVKSYSYAGVYILDRDAQVVLHSRRSIPLNPLFTKACRDASNSGVAQIALVGDAPNRSQVGFSAPVFLGPGANDASRAVGKVLGMVLVVSDASQTLFPLVTREAIPSRTNETILVRREGNAIVYFSPRRLAPTGSRQLRFPLPTAPLAARLALEGRETFVEDTDYRGVPVLAATQYIPLAGWGLVRKIDRAEATKGFHRLMIEEWLTAGLRLILLGCLLLFHRHHVVTRELKQEEKKFQAVLESAPDVMIVIGRNGQLMFVNSATERMFGYELEELLGKSVLTLVPERFRAERAEYYSRLFSHPALQDQEVQQDRWGLRKDGSEFPAEETSSRIETLQGAVVAIAIRDVTERKQVEEALRQSEASLREALLAAQMGVWEWTVATGTVTWDENLYRIAGQDPKLPAPSYQEHSKILAPESWERLKAAVENALATGTPYELDLELVRPDGAKRWLIGRGEPRRDASGHVTQLRGTVQDITERKRAEAELFRLVTAIEQSGEAVVMTDPAGRIEYVNPAFTRITGYSREEVLGKNPRILKSDKQDPAFYQQLWATILKGEIWHGEITNQRKDGKLYPEEMTIAPVRDALGEVTHFIATQQDVTERKTLEERLRQSAKMEAIGRLAGGVAHDFNNLLTVINGYTELLQERFVSDHQASAHLTEIKNAGERAASLTRQLLAFSPTSTLGLMRCCIYNRLRFHSVTMERGRAKFSPVL